MKSLITLCLAAVLVFPAMASGAEVYELNIASPVSTVHPIHIYLADLCKELEEKSGGRLKFNIFDNNTLVKGDGMFKALKNGGTDIGLLTPSFLPADLPYSVTHDMTFMSSDAVKAGELMWAMCDLPEIQAELAKANVELLWASSGDRPGLGSLNTPIRKMSDIRGKRVLIWQANLSEEVKAWGGIPVQITIPDTYVALQRGMGEVLYVAIPMFQSLKLQELIKYLTIMPATLSGTLWPISNHSLEALPADLQQLLREETGLKATLGMSGAVRDACLRDLQLMADAGVEIIELDPDELAPWKEASLKALAPYWQDVLKRTGNPDPDQWIQQVRNLAAEIEAAH